MMAYILLKLNSKLKFDKINLPAYNPPVSSAGDSSPLLVNQTFGNFTKI
jgi:hypothetical protein